MRRPRGIPPADWGATLAYLEKERREEKGKRERGGVIHRKEARTQLLSHGVL